MYFIKILELKKITLDEYIYLEEKTTNIKDLDDKIIKELLKERFNQLEFDKRMKISTSNLSKDIIQLGKNIN